MDHTETQPLWVSLAQAAASFLVSSNLTMMLGTLYLWRVDMLP